MADTVTTRIVNEDSKYVVVHFTNISDGTGEDAIKVDRSAFVTAEGGVPTNLAIASVRWNIQGFTRIKVYWEYAGGDVTAFVLAGSGYENYEMNNGALTSGSANAGATDGDIKFATTGTVSGNSYDITLKVEKRI